MFREVSYCLGFVINLRYFKTFLFIETSRKLIDQENATARLMKKLAMGKNDFEKMNIKSSEQNLKANEVLRKELNFYSQLALTLKACLNAEMSKFSRASCL